MPLTSYGTAQFLDEYELSLDKEFSYDGLTATWASGMDGPRLWDEEDASIDWTPLKPTDDPRRRRRSAVAAMTADGRYLALARDELLRIYDVASRRMCSELVGHADEVDALFFVNIREPSGDHFGAHYILLSESKRETILAWHIDGHGRLVNEKRTPPIAVDLLADLATDSVTPALKAHHDLNDSALADIRAGFANALREVDAAERVRGIPSWKGRFNHFGSDPVSHDCRLFIYVAEGESTQRGMRSADKLPQLVIVDVSSLQEKCRLSGCRDAIMWAGWSLDDSIVAAACWDQTFRLWNAETGESLHVISDTDGQNWRGAFLPDGKHVLFSGGRPVDVSIYDLQTADKVAQLKAPDGVELDHWMRYLTVHPVENLIILQNARTLLAWRPFHGREGGDVEEILALTPDEEKIKNRFAAIYSLKWVDQGTKLVAQGSDSTTFVWSIVESVKWRFQRQSGRKWLGSGHDAFFARFAGNQWILTVDNDDVMRYWKL